MDESGLSDMIDLDLGEYENMSVASSMIDNIDSSLFDKPRTAAHTISPGYNTQPQKTELLNLPAKPRDKSTIKA